MKKKKKNYHNRSKPEDIVVLRLVSYLWNIICFIQQLLYKIAYI